MSTLTLSAIDTLAYVKRLKEADVPEKQAEAQAEFLREVLNAALDEQASSLATKGDIALVHKDIALIHKDMEALRKDMETLENRLIIKLSAVMAGLIAFAGAVQVLVGKL